MDFLSNTVKILPYRSVPPPLEKEKSTPFLWLTPKADLTEDFHFFDDCFISSDFNSINDSIYPKAHMYIQSPDFDYISLLQTDILPIIFDTGASLSISLYKMDFLGPINTLPQPMSRVRQIGCASHS